MSVTKNGKLSRRNFLKLSATAAGASLLAACPAPSPDTPQVIPPEDAPVTEEAVTLNYMIRGGDYIAGVVNQQIAAFNEHHPNIRIEPDMTPGAHQEKLQLQVAAGTPPDCWFDAFRTTGLFWHLGIAEDLEPYLEVEPDFEEDKFIDNAWIAQTYEGKRWGLPWDSGGVLLCFNIDMFEEAGLPLPDHQTPMSWDELLEVAKQLTLDFEDRHPDDPEFDPTRIKRYGFQPWVEHEIWLWANGAEIIEADMTCPIDTPEAIESFQWRADLGLRHFVSPSPAFEQTVEISMQSRTVAMQYTGVWMLGRYNDAGLNWGTAPFPTNTVPVSYGHYSPLCMTQQGQHKQETFDWIYWSCMSEEGQAILVDTGMQQPIRRSLIDRFLDDPQPPEQQYRQAYFDVFDPDTFRWPGDKIGSFWNGYKQMQLDLWGPELDPVWAGRVEYAEIASDLREKTERVLQTGELF